MLDEIDASARAVDAAVHAEAASILGKVDNISDQLQALMTIARQGQVVPAILDAQQCADRQQAASSSNQSTTAEMTAVRCLLSKPSVLKEALDSVGEAPVVERSQQALGHANGLDFSKSRYSCICRQYSVSHEQHTKISCIRVSSATVDSFRHFPGCWLFQSPAGRKTTKRVVKARVSFFRVTIEAAFVVASAWPSGAGGLGISPTLVATVMVNAETAPAFRVFKVLDSFYSGYHRFAAESGDDDPSRTAEGMLDHALQKLRTLFQTRRAMPSDVDENGNTLMHSYAGLVGNLERTEKLLAERTNFRR